MPATKQKKAAFIDDLKKILDKASILIFVNFHGLSVAKTEKLRSELRRAEVNYKVAKKTFLKLALRAIGLGEMPKMEGEIGVAIGKGEVSKPARIVAKFAKGNDELKIVGGFYENAFVDASLIKKIAAIPPREALLAELAFIFTQPVAAFARALGEVAKTKGQN